jgi:NAD(P)-dependent dehydrogenase (short-subunit alcohol dehydrogenase family)
VVAGDLRQPDHCRAVIQKAVDELGGIEILVNNAAHQATFKDIGDISDEEWETTFQVNIHAMFYLAKAAVPYMRPGSAVVSTASVNSDMPNPTLLAYATTKGAIQNFTGGLAQMLAEKGHPSERGGAGTDLDAANSIHHARGGRSSPHQTPWCNLREDGGSAASLVSIPHDKSRDPSTLRPRRADVLDHREHVPPQVVGMED